MPTGSADDRAVGERTLLLQERDEEDKAKLEWLRAAAKQGFDDLARGDYVTLRSEDEIDAFVDQLRKEASDELAAEITRG
jgi:hypothetical protein